MQQTLDWYISQCYSALRRLQISRRNRPGTVRISRVPWNGFLGKVKMGNIFYSCVKYTMYILTDKVCESCWFNTVSKNIANIFTKKGLTPTSFKYISLISLSTYTLQCISLTDITWYLTDRAYYVRVCTVPVFFIFYFRGKVRAKENTCRWVSV
jgi:hypothetical protein